MMAIRTPILKKGDTFGIIAPASPLDPAAIDAGIGFLEGLGYHVVLGEHVYAKDGYLAGTAEQRAADLMSMYKNPHVKVILPVRGGVGTEGILPYLDYRFIAEHPKIITGYSDVSILLNVIYQFCCQITHHSLMLLDFNDASPAYNFEQYFDDIATTLAPRQILSPPAMPTVSRVAGNVTGPLVGGNLVTVIGSLGTTFEINTKGKIFFLEEVNEPVNKVYRYILQLIVAGKFRDCIGIVMGECSDCTDEYGKSYDDLINEVLVPLGKPLLTNIACGHGKYKAALPIGAKVNLNTFANTLTLLEPTVK